MPLTPLLQHQPSANCAVPEPEKDCAQPSCRVPVGPAPEYVGLDAFACLVAPYATFKDSAGERFGAPAAAIASAVRDTLVDFTRRTRILRRVARHRTQPHIGDYYLKPNANESVSIVTRVDVDGCCILNTDDLSCCGVEDKFHFIQPDCVVIHPHYWSRSCAIEVRYAAEVTRDATQIDRIILARHSDAITQGAAARLMMLPGWEWTRPDFAQNARSTYETAVHAALNEVLINFSLGGRSAITKHRF